MSQSVTPVKISILGKEFQIGCAPHERAALFEAATHVDNQMREIRDAGRIVGGERIAILVALNVANELLEARSELARLHDQVARCEALADHAERLAAQESGNGQA